MHNICLQNIVLPSSKSGTTVKIKVLTGPLTGKQFQATKVKETVNNVLINCYHIVNDTKTYFLEKDIIEV